MDEGDLHEFVERTRTVVSQSPEMSARNTGLRVVLPLLETLGWDVYGPEVEAEYAVEPGDPGGGEAPTRDGSDHDSSPSARRYRTPDEESTATDPGDADDTQSPASDDSAGEVVVDYAMLFEGTPVAFVVAQSPGEDLPAADGRRLAAAMDAADVDWGLVTSGTAFAFVTSEGDGVERFRCDLGELPDNASVLAHYSRPAARRRHERRRRDARREVAQRLSDRRDGLVSSVEDALTDATGGALADELSDASAAFVDGVVDALAAGDHPDRHRSTDDTPDDAAEPDESEGRSGTDGADRGDRPDSGSDDAGPHPTGGVDTDPGDPPETSGDSSGAEPDDRTEPAESSRRATDDGAGADAINRERDDGEEYVVRFFNDRTSVGAVGHPTVAGATAQALEYLVEQHALDSRLRLPWAPGDVEDRAVINREPVHPDGTEMAATEQLSNGYYLCATMDAEASQAVVEMLADRSGLRTMFQGDW